MAYQSILQVTARNYASDIMRGAPKFARFVPLTGGFAYTFVYPQYGRPKIGIIYAPYADGEVYMDSKSYDWVGVKIGNQYGWVNLREVDVRDVPVLEVAVMTVQVDELPEVLEVEAEVVTDEVEEIKPKQTKPKSK